MSQKSQHLLASDHIPQLLLKLSLPAMTGMLVMALYNIVDTIFVGRGVGTLALAGISIVFPLQLFVLAIGLLLGIGSASLISRSIGAGDHQKVQQTFGNTFCLLTLISIILMTFGYIFTNSLLKLFGTTPTILPYAKTYLRIILAGTPLFLIAMSSNNILRSEGKATASMSMMILSSGLNIVLDPIFIFVFKLGVAGAAWATVLAQLIGVIGYGIIFLGNRSAIRPQWRYFRIQWDITKEVFAVGISSFFRHVAGSFVFIIANNQISLCANALGIAAFGIVMRLTRFVFMPLFGIAQGLQPILGYNFGARRYAKIITAVKTAFLGALGIAFGGFVIIQLFPSQIIQIFTADPELIPLASQALRLMMIILPVVVLQILASTFFQALGKAIPAIILSISREFLFLVPLLLLFPKYFQLPGVWLAFPAADFLSALLSLYLLGPALQKIRTSAKEN